MMQLHRLPVRTPVENAHLRQQKTEKRNGVTVCSLSLEVDTVSRCQPQATHARIVQKAKASGKAREYANVDTVMWKVEDQVR